MGLTSGAHDELFDILNVQNFEIRHSEAVGRLIIFITAILIMYIKLLGPKTAVGLLPLHPPLVL